MRNKLFLFILLCLISTTGANGATLIHCDHEPGLALPCTDAQSLPEIPLGYIQAIGANGDTVRRAEKLLYHILSGPEVGKAQTIEFKLYEVTAGEPVYKDQSIVNPESNWYSCWVLFTYFLPGKYILQAYLDGQFTAEDTFEIKVP